MNPRLQNLSLRGGISILLLLLTAATAQAARYSCEGTLECYKLPNARTLPEGPDNAFGTIGFSDEALTILLPDTSYPEFQIPVNAVRHTPESSHYFVMFESIGIVVTLFNTGTLNVVFSNAGGNEMPGMLQLQCEVLE